MGQPDYTLDIAIEVNINGSDIEFTDVAVSDSKTYIQGYDHDTGNHFIMAVEGDGGLGDAGNSNTARRHAMSEFKNSLDGDKLTQIFQNDRAFRTVIKADDLADGLNPALLDKVQKVNKVEEFDRINAKQGTISQLELRSLKEKFQDVAKDLTKRIPVPAALVIGGMLMSQGAMAADELAIAAIPGGNSVANVSQGNYMEAAMSLIDDF
jgi:hypothetical protein